MKSYPLLIITSDSNFFSTVRDNLSREEKRSSTQISFHLLQAQDLSQAEVLQEQHDISAVLVDCRSQTSSCLDLFEKLNSSSTDIPLISITDSLSKDDQDLQSPESSSFLLTREELSSSLLGPFLENTISQSRLIQTLKVVRDDLNQRLEELQSIRRASLHLTLNLSLDDVLDAILESALHLIQAEDAHVFLYEHGVLQFGAALFDGKQQKQPYMDPRPDGITYHVARSGEKIVVNDVMTDPLFEGRRWEGSIISLPLKMGSEILGVMNVALTTPHQFSENEIRALQMLGDQASIAIYNAKLYQQAQQEIEERKRAEKAIKHLATHDALTGLPNRRLFNERIQLEISHAERDGKKIAVVLFDLDQLKKVNDTYGHNLGDLLLQSVGQRLIGLLRKSDTIARMGGDEFLLILPGVRHAQDAIQTAERILEALSEPFQLEGNQIRITTSIGISIFPDHGSEVDHLVKLADQSMYHAKDKGGNTYHLYS